MIFICVIILLLPFTTSSQVELLQIKAGLGIGLVDQVSFDPIPILSPNLDMDITLVKSDGFSKILNVFGFGFYQVRNSFRGNSVVSPEIYPAASDEMWFLDWESNLKVFTWTMGRDWQIRKSRLIIAFHINHQLRNGLFVSEAYSTPPMLFVMDYGHEDPLISLGLKLGLEIKAFKKTSIQLAYNNNDITFDLIDNNFRRMDYFSFGLGYNLIDNS